MAEELGIVAAFGFPMLVGAETTGVLEFFAAKAVEPDVALLEVMAHIGTQLGRVIERKLAETALRDSDDRYARAVAGTNDGIRDWNLRTEENYFSPRWKAILGYEPDELEPRTDTFVKLIHPEDRSRVMKANRAHIANKVLYDIEYRMRHKDGRYIWVRSRGQATWDDDGAPLSMAGSMTDITERRELEGYLAHEQILSEAIRENMDQGILVTDATGTIVAHNRRFEEFYDVPDGLLATGTTYQNFMRAMTERGEFGSMSAEEAIEKYAAPVLKGKA